MGKLEQRLARRDGTILW